MVIVEKVDDWVMPKDVADVMLRCVVESAFVGGSIWEVAGRRDARKVEAFMDVGPPVGAHGKTEPEKWSVDVWNRLGVEGWGQ